MNKLVPAPNTNEFTYKLYAYSKLAEILLAFKVVEKMLRPHHISIFVVCHKN